jgi:hypothetical protein
LHTERHKVEKGGSGKGKGEEYRTLTATENKRKEKKTIMMNGVEALVSAPNSCANKPEKKERGSLSERKTDDL